MRESIVRAMGKMGEVSVSEELLKIVNSDPDNLVRKTAAAAMGKIGNTEQFEGLVRSLNGKESLVADEIMNSVVRICGKNTDNLKRMVPGGIYLKYHLWMHHHIPLPRQGVFVEQYMNPTDPVKMRPHYRLPVRLISSSLLSPKSVLTVP